MKPFSRPEYFTESYRKRVRIRLRNARRTKAGKLRTQFHHLKQQSKPGFRIKKLAWLAVYQAVRSGKLIRKACEVCGKRKTQAHHSNYSNRLNVKWLCALCHKREHSAIQPNTPK